MSSIYKKRAIWYYQVSSPRNNGANKRVQFSLRTKNKKEALAFKDEWDAHYDGYATSNTSHGPLLKDRIEEYLIHKRRSASSLGRSDYLDQSLVSGGSYRDEISLRLFYQFLLRRHGDLSIIDISKSHCRLFIKSRITELSSRKELRLNLRYLDAFLSHLVSNGELKTNPCEDITLPDKNERRSSRKPTVLVEYDKLVEDYWDALSTKLRGFTASDRIGFLDSWVPEENDLNNIVSLLIEASEAGLKNVSIRMTAATMKKIDEDQLLSSGGEFGEVQLIKKDSIVDFLVSIKDGDNLGGERSSSLVGKPVRAKTRKRISRKVVKTERLKIHRPSERSTLDRVHAIYRKKLTGLVKNSVHNRLVSSKPGLDLVEVSLSGVTLTVLVNPSSHKVLTAGFSSESSLTEVQIGLLEGLCNIIENKPMQECSDHSVLYLENMLRDESKEHQFDGIIMPENANLAFEFPLRFARALKEKYYTKNNLKDSENFFDALPSKHWQDLTDDRRYDLIQSAIKRHDLGGCIRLLRMEDAERTIVEFTEDIDVVIKHNVLMELESFLKKTVESKLQLYLQPKYDVNKLRQTKGVVL